ncbi:MAG: DUF934 domain-containing protein [Methylococcaceae bacterium]|nr:DUF934 domain-containing protein [Methylococcaceae bacterium]
MQIIKDQQLTDNTWQSLSDDDQLSAGDISVSLTRWQHDKAQLLAHDGKLGIRIHPSDDVAGIADDLPKLQLIELDFPDFADGRLFSQAWLLRGRYHYQGELRATGKFMSGQVFYLSRVGVNAFAPEKAEDLPIVLANLQEFTVNYQNSIN